MRNSSTLLSMCVLPLNPNTYNVHVFVDVCAAIDVFVDVCAVTNIKTNTVSSAFGVIPSAVKTMPEATSDTGKKVPLPLLRLVHIC